MLKGKQELSFSHSECIQIENTRMSHLQSFGIPMCLFFVCTFYVNVTYIVVNNLGKK